MLEGKLIIIPALGHQNIDKSSFTGSDLFVLMSQCENNHEGGHGKNLVTGGGVMQLSNDTSKNSTSPSYLLKSERSLRIELKGKNNSLLLVFTHVISCHGFQPKQKITFAYE